MSWAAERVTTREEDIAYSLMGLFKVNMPILYGEGAEKAFRRLQHEIIKVDVDHEIFMWCAPDNTTNSSGLLANSPKAFKDFPRYLAPNIHRSSLLVDQKEHPIFDGFTLTNKGLSLRLPMRHVKGPVWLARLSTGFVADGILVGIWIYLSEVKAQQHNRLPSIYRRIECDSFYHEEYKIPNTESQDIIILEDEHWNIWHPFLELCT